MLLIGGRHFIRQELKGGLQEMNHPLLFQGITAWAATAWEVGRLADYVATAARHAFSGRGAPVFLDVPMDVQFDMIDDDAIAWPRGLPDPGPAREPTRPDWSRSWLRSKPPPVPSSSPGPGREMGQAIG